MATLDTQYWVEEEQLIYLELQKEWKLREEAILQKFVLYCCRIYWVKAMFGIQKR